jgi:hypothetical protein
MQLERPHDFWISFALGRRLAEQKKYEETTEYFLMAVALRPDSGLTHSALG